MDQIESWMILTWIGMQMDRIGSWMILTCSNFWSESNIRPRSNPIKYPVRTGQVHGQNFESNKFFGSSQVNVSPSLNIKASGLDRIQIGS